MELNVWVEKYRPKTIDDLVMPEETKEEFREHIKEKLQRNMIFAGCPGTGKTTVAKILAKTPDVTCLWLNGSDERGLETVRDEIKGFASTKSFSQRKVVIIDEGEALTTMAFAALKGITERYYTNTSFIITTNFLYQIPKENLSRFTIYEFTKLEKVEVLKYYKRVLDAEHVKYTEADLEQVFRICNGDLRKSLYYLQKNSKKGRLVIKFEEYTTIVKLIKEENVISLKEYFVNHSIDFATLYRYLYEKTSNKEKILVIGKYLDQHTTSLDPEITFMNCAIDLMKIKS
jgi:replication factor C small subunit